MDDVGNTLYAHTPVRPITHIEIKNFRCFTHYAVAITHPIVLIKGNNGSGKTSLLEALYYACYFRSFKHCSVQDLMHFKSAGFFIKIDIGPLQDTTQLHIGFAPPKRSIKINHHAIHSYKELLHNYRIICITQEDLSLIQEGPRFRRSFIDQLLVLYDPTITSVMKELKKVQDNRHAIVAKNADYDTYHVWSQQLWKISLILQEKRERILHLLQEQLNALLLTYFNARLTITLTYNRRLMVPADDDFDHFINRYPLLRMQEYRQRRSLFGAHLDDITIALNGYNARDFGSRGQQKLIVLCLKIAQSMLLQDADKSLIFLLDDFMTDLDASTADILLKILVTLQAQLIFTSPVNATSLEQQLHMLSFQTIQL